MKITLFAVMVWMSVGASAGLVRDYGGHPGEVQGTRASNVSVDGTAVFRHKHPSGDFDYIHFSFTNSCEVQLTALTTVSNVVPAALGVVPVLAPAAGGKTQFTFTITKPGTYLILRYDDSAKNNVITYPDGSTESAAGPRGVLMAIFAEAPTLDEPQLGDPGVYDATSLGVAASPTVSQTVPINQAIEAVAAGGGGTLFFPPGVYLTGMIQMKDNVYVYIDAGASIQATTNFDDTYGEFEWAEDGSEQRDSQGLFVFDRVENCGIRGHGQAVTRTNADEWKWNLRVRRSRNILLEGIVWANRDRGGAMVLNNCSYVEINNWKGLGWLRQTRTDPGPIMDSSSHVTVNNSSGFGLDDGFQIGSRSPEWETMRNYTIRNSFNLSYSGSFRNGGWGFENYWDLVTGVTFDHVYMISGDERSQLGASGVQRNFRNLHVVYDNGGFRKGDSNFGGNNPPGSPWTAFEDSIYYNCVARTVSYDAAVTKGNVVYQGLRKGSGPAAAPTLTPISSRTDAQNAGFTITTGVQFQP